MRGGDSTTRTVRVPVRFLNGGQIEYFYGGPVPGIRAGAVGDLVVALSSFRNRREAVRLQEERVVPFLTTGALVRLTIAARGVPENLRHHLIEGRTFLRKGRPYAIEVLLLEPLGLRLRGSKEATLETAKCWVPAVKKVAESLNHAYRLISERFEPLRRSHSGNVFELGYLHSQECLGHPRGFPWATRSAI